MAFNPSGAASTAGSFSKIAFGLIIIIIVASIITMVIQKKSLAEGLINVGETFFLSTKALGEESKNIIAQEGVIDIHNGFKQFFISMFSSYGKLLLSFLSILLWIRVFAFFTSRSNTANPFSAYLLAILFFYFFQVIFLLGYAGVTKDINGFTGDKSVVYYIELPILCFWQFIQAIPFLIKPLSKICGEDLSICTTIA